MYKIDINKSQTCKQRDSQISRQGSTVNRQMRAREPKWP